MTSVAKYDGLEQREWLCATGGGGYALGTSSGVATRRYHGNLIVAYPPPLGRIMVWPRTEEVLVTAGGRSVPIARAWYGPGVLTPVDAVEAVAFSLAPDGSPCWVFDVEGHRIRRRLTVGERHAELRFDLLSGDPCDVLVRPLLTWRSHHHLIREPDVSSIQVTFGGEVEDDQPHVYENALCPRERDRGYDYEENLVAPLQVRLPVGGDRSWLRVSVGSESESCPPADPVARAAASFIVRRPDGHRGIIAGYPWFGEWGRDTMIAIPGLLLPHDPGGAREIMEAWCQRLRRGLLPCQLSDGSPDELHTNTADAALRMLDAAAALYLVEPGSVDQPLREAVFAVLDAYHEGTDHGIFVDDDGLLVAGAPGAALTWMDAIGSDGPVTPRRGKAVDLNALYLRGLRLGARLAGDADGALQATLTMRAERCAAALGSRFFNPDVGWIRDVVDPEDPTAGEELRPNLLVALGTPGIPWPDGAAERTLQAVEQRLLTPRGLRTLDPEHPDYQPHYNGDQQTRDRAYHQGTVWPWLMGPYADAVINVRGDGLPVREALGQALAPLMSELRSVGSLHEVHDGAAPHLPGGCPAQAWSVSEVVRAWRLASRGAPGLE